MRILHIIDSAGFYGAERVVTELMHAQIERGLDPLLCSIGRSGAPEKALERQAAVEGLPLRALRFGNGPNPVGAARLLRLAREADADLLHSHGYKGDILLGLLPRALRRRPMVSTLHGWTNTGELDRMRLYQWLDARALSRVERVVVVHRAMLDDPRLPRRGPAMRCVPNGIRPQPAGEPPGGPEWEIFEPRGLRLGCVGRLSAEKGHDRLIRAVARLVRSGVDCRLFILGDGECRPALEALIDELGLGRRVLLAGYRERPSRYLAYCDLWVLPSLTEGLPITLLEAMQRGCPIVATRVGAVPDVLDRGRAGMLVEPGDGDALERAIAELGADPERGRRLGAAAREIAGRVYSAEAMERGYREVYEEMLAGETNR